MLFIAYNLFHTFLERNLKPQAREGRSEKYGADLIAADFVATFHRSPPRKGREPRLRIALPTGFRPKRLPIPFLLYRGP